MYNNIIFFILLFCLTKTSYAGSQEDSIEISVIVENCKSCHSESYEGNEYIKSLKQLKKSQFVKKMKQYKDSKENSVMVRITSVLSNEDILKISEYIYDKDSKN